MRMRKLCPNLEREDALETVLEVPVPEEAPFRSSAKAKASKLKNVKAWMRSQIAPSSLGRGAQLQLMLGVIAAPLVPHPLDCHNSITRTAIKTDPIEVSMAKYIVQQYIAAAGGEEALSKVHSMYAMGKLQMKSTEARSGDRSSEMGGFVLWQKQPHLWCIELMVSGCKITAGSDGKVAWRQTQWQQARASRGAPRPLRRCIQGLDPRSTADLFTDAVWVGERTISRGDDCFVLRVDSKPASLQARSSSQAEVVRHTVWGYFCQKTGLLVQLEDTHLLKIQDNDNDTIYWETNMESLLSDYRTIEGVNIAHSGQTTASLLRFGGGKEAHGRTKSQMEEIWEIEEIDFNIVGLSMDCFLPPADLKDPRGDDKQMEKEKESCAVSAKNAPPLSGGKVQGGAGAWFGPVKVVAIDSEDSDSTQDGDERP